MGRREQVQNEELRGLIDESYAQMRQGQASDAVRTLVRCFLRLIELRPDLISRTIETAGGQRYPFLMSWPALGADLSFESLRKGKPEIELKRERFAISEAMTYYEFVLDTLLSSKM